MLFANVEDPIAAHEGHRDAPEAGMNEGSLGHTALCLMVS
jgi:hypothetical protein